ncbi:Nucleotidyltransferase [Auricularia subglabra TFB-10046 SS5]|nr:Nucleotidyltransferase [Auricularia subglabra TFB-10046 SS5]
MQVHESRGHPEDHWRVISYRKAISALRRHPTRIKSAEEAERLHGVGKKTADKIMEILGTGNLQRLKTEREHGHDVVALFRGIYSVGSKIAWEWYAKGLRTLDDVRERKGGIRLNSAQEIGLRYYDDLNERMPRAEAGEIFGMIKQRVLDIDPNLTLEIMGSYRRRKETCGDIDILITRNPSDGKTHAGVLRKLLRVLHADGILTENLSMPHDTHALEAKYMGICRRDATSKRRRIDILTIPFEQWGGALLYFTGDDIFNRSMRLKANKMGMSLNQRGLYRNVIRDPTKWNNKLDDGELFASKTEKEIFDALGVPWQEPWERVRG